MTQLIVRNTVNYFRYYRKYKRDVSRFPGCITNESYKEWKDPWDSDVSSEFRHIQKRRQLFGGIPEESAESR